MNYKRKAIPKPTFNGIQFDSGLEVEAYKALLNSGIPFEYEPHSFILHEKLSKPSCTVHERYGTKFTKRKSVEAIKYTPDFGPVKSNDRSYNPSWIMETKGHKTAQYRLRKRIFLFYLHAKGSDCIFVAPSNVKEIHASIELIKEHLKNKACALNTED